MKQYPTIPSQVIQGASFYAFDKLDGSNIRAEWNKRGFYKFGTRTRLLDPNEPILGQAVSLIQDKYSVDLSERLKDSRVESAVCFFELWGANSAFGQHDPNEKQTVTLIDVDIYRHGLLSPKDFLDFSDGLDIPKMLYHGNIDQDFIKSVNDGTLSGLGPEGVVCKGLGGKKKLYTIMFKIKRADWYQRLKDYCKGDLRLFEERR